MESIIYTEMIGDKYILKLEAWQLEDIRNGLSRLYKQRDVSNKYIEKKRQENENPKKSKSSKPRLVISSPPKTPPMLPTQTLPMPIPTLPMPQPTLATKEDLIKLTEILQKFQLTDVVKS